MVASASRIHLAGRYKRAAAVVAAEASVPPASQQPLRGCRSLEHGPRLLLV